MRSWRYGVRLAARPGAIALAASSATAVGLLVAAWTDVLRWSVALLAAALAALLFGGALVAWWVRLVRQRMEAVAREERAHSDLLRRHVVELVAVRTQAMDSQRLVAAAQEKLSASLVELGEELAGQRRRVDGLTARLADLLAESRQLGETANGVAGAVEALPDRVSGAVARATDRSAARVQSRLYPDVYEKLEAYASLLAVIEPRAPMPALGGWALNADVLHTVAEVIWEHRPALVVECGSGSSSVWLGYLLERIGSGRVVALEHDSRFLRESRGRVRLHGLERFVEVRHAPLESWTDGEGDATPYRWYARSALADLEGIGVLLVDGPPGDTGPRARYPAGPVLLPRCTKNAVVVLDDTVRAEEKEISDQWLARWPDLVRTMPRHGSAHLFWRGPVAPQPEVTGVPEDFCL